jgi:hypothetical protein
MQSILQVPGGPDLSYLLGIINSRLMSWYFLHRSNVAQRDDFPKIVLKETRALPIHLINPDLGKERTIYNRIISSVDDMMALFRQLVQVKTPHEKETIQRQIDATDKQIDHLVYQLYGLTVAEIKIVEEQNRR